MGDVAMDKLMAKPKKLPVTEREPVAVFEIPVGMRDSELGLSSNRTINAWALDRLLAYLGAHSVEIIDSVAMCNNGKYAEVVRDGDNLLIFDRL
jgi:hypothetical protein